MDNESEFVLGLDLGQAQDFTAVAIVERVRTSQRVETDHGPFVDVEEKAGPVQLHARHLERFQLGTTYPAIIERIHAMLRTPQLRNCTLVVDATGCGRPVLDMMRDTGLRPIGVTITGGDLESKEDPENWRVAKKILVSHLQVVLQEQRLKFAADLPDIDTMVQELLNFRAKISAAGNDSYESWREGVHDDLVLALSLAVWEMERNTRAWWIS